jgi:hypothetical protein
LLISTGGFVGFIAFVGGAMTYARFATADLPAEQAIGAMPEGALLASGATEPTSGFGQVEANY